MAQNIYTNAKNIIKDTISEVLIDWRKYTLKIVILTFVLFLISHIDDIITTLVYRIEIWKGLSILFLVYFARYIYLYKTEKSKMKHEFIKYGLKWDVIIKKNKSVLIKGPFCTKCSTPISESDLSKDNILQCSKCNNKYNVCEGNTIHLKEKIKKVIYSDLRSDTNLMIDWRTFNYLRSYLKVTNCGTFLAENIKININLTMLNKIEHIGSYSFGNIIPDETK